MTTLALIDQFTADSGTQWERDLIAVIRRVAEAGLVVRVEAVNMEVCSLSDDTGGASATWEDLLERAQRWTGTPIGEVAEPQ